MLHCRCGGRRPSSVGMHFECFLHWKEWGVLCRNTIMPHSDSMGSKTKALIWWLENSWALLLFDRNTNFLCILLPRLEWFPNKLWGLLIWVNRDDRVHFWGQCMRLKYQHYYHSVHVVGRWIKNWLKHITRSDWNYCSLKWNMLRSCIRPSWFDPHRCLRFHSQLDWNRFPIRSWNVLWRDYWNKTLHR